MSEFIPSLVAALAAGAVAGLKPTAEKAVKDAYEGLKGLIVRAFPGADVHSLEKAPLSEARKTVLAEELSENAPATDPAELLQAAKTLLAAIESAGSSDAGVRTQLRDLSAKLDIEIIGFRNAIAERITSSEGRIYMSGIGDAPPNT